MNWYCVIHKIKAWQIVACVAVIVYIAGYFVARYRKCLVMHEYSLAKFHGIEGLGLRREIGIGYDFRDNLRGRIKRQINPIAHVVFRPCIILENLLRGGDVP